MCTRSPVDDGLMQNDANIPDAAVIAHDSASMADATTLRVVEIAPSTGWSGVDFREIWAYRELLYILVWRDLKVRYRQTLLGAVWVMGQPLLTMLIFTLVFNRLARIDSGAIPYTVFVLSGLLPWTFFATGVQGAASSLVGNANLISKVYFPRLLIPAAGVAGSLVDFLVAGVVLAGMLVWHQILPSANVMFLPLAILLATAITLGLGLLLAALNVKYRDVRVMIPFVLQLWMFATPVVYPQSLLPEPWKSLAFLNPLVGVVEGFRWCLFGGELPGLALLATLVAGLVLLSSGMLLFRRMERSFVDIV